MAYYLRQLRNDEKRCTFSMVGTVTPEFATTTAPDMPLFVVPKRSTIARIYIVHKEAFAAGATISVNVYKGDEAPKVLFTGLPLDVSGTIEISDASDNAGRWKTNEYVGVKFNQAAVDSVIGEAKIVIEFTEVPVTAGAYSK